MPTDPDQERSRPDGVITIPPDSRWPFAIIVGLLIVVAVNMTFIYVAVSGADTVVPSYEQADR